MGNARPTLAWSKAINLLNAWREKRETALEERRKRALAGLPGAERHLDAWRAGVAKAVETRNTAIETVNRKEREALLEAAGERSAGYAKAESELRLEEDLAYDEHRDAEEKIEDAFRKAVAAAREKHGTSEAYLKSRQKAERVRVDGLAKARRAYESARKKLRRKRDHALREARRKEYGATNEAHRKRASAVAAAEREHEKTLRELDRKLRGKLAGIPEAHAIERRIAAAKRALAEEHRRREEKIFRDLRKALG